VWRVVDRLRGFLNLSYKKIKKNIYKERVLEKQRKPSTTLHKRGYQL
jgi:hypothetical protein